VSTIEKGFEARFWHPLADSRIQCDLCPRYCKLHEGQRGLCFVRARRDGRMVLTTYGRSSGFCIDPIEKKPLNHFLPGTPVLSFGTAGCNLTCRFCQNWDISKAGEFDRLTEEASAEAIADAAVRSGCRSVAFTYNDPVVFVEYAIDVAEACRARGVKTVAVSAGYMCDAPRQEFYRHIDAANIDLKGFTEAFYKKLCTGSLSAVLETLAYLKHETRMCCNFGGGGW
jgi:pyruvate formate lyase activating enzyme